MCRYKNNGIMITFGLEQATSNEKYKGYSVEYIYNYIICENIYKVTMRLRCVNIPESYSFNTSDMDEEFVLTSTKENIKLDLAKDFESRVENGYFDKHIDNFEFLLKCFDAGYSQISKAGD